MNRPTAPEWSDEKYPDDTSAWAYEDERDEFILQANAYMDHLESELTQLRTERERLLEYLGRIRPLAKSIALISEADQDAKDMADSIWTISIAALTKREGGQQICPPVVDSANDSREGGGA